MLGVSVHFGMAVERQYIVLIQHHDLITVKQCGHALAETPILRALRDANQVTTHIHQFVLSFWNREH